MNNKVNSTRLSEVITYLNIKSSTILKDLEDINIHISASTFSRMKKGDALSDDLIRGMFKLYGINPDFLKGTSSEMFTEAEVNFQIFSKLVKEWRITEYGSKDNNTNKRYLHLTMDRFLYDFLISYDEAVLLKELGSKCFDEEISRRRKEYYKNIEKYEKEDKKREKTRYQEYVLLPKDNFLEIPIVGVKGNPRKYLHELIDYTNHENYHKSNTIIKLKTTDIK